MTDVVQFGVAIIGCIVLAVIVIYGSDIGSIENMKTMLLSQSETVLDFFPSIKSDEETDILGGAKTTLLGSYIISQFLTASNWPFGAAISVVLMAVMLVTTIIYFRKGGRTL